MDAETAQRLSDLERRLSRLESAQQPGAIVAWTPRFGGTTNAGTFTYTFQTGGYCRIGPYLFFHGRVAISAITAVPLGLMVVDGLPVAAANVAGHYGGCWFDDISNFNYTAAALAVTGLIQPNEGFIRLLESFDNAASVSVPAANFTNASCSLIFSGMYRVS